MPNIQAREGWLKEQDVPGGSYVLLVDEVRYPLTKPEFDNLIETKQIELNETAKLKTSVMLDERARTSAWGELA
jgi:hypothetical protein